MLARKLNAVPEPLDSSASSDPEPRSSIEPGGLEGTSASVDRGAPSARRRVGFDAFAAACSRLAESARLASSSTRAEGEASSAELRLYVGDARALRGLAAHAVRSFQASGVPAQCFARIGEADPWVSLARALGVDCPSAARITGALAAHAPGVFVVVDDRPSRFASAVLNDLDAQSGALGAHVLVLTSSAPDWLQGRAEHVASTLAPEGLRAWWSSVEDAFLRNAPFTSVADLDAWWSASLERPSLERPLAELSDDARLTAGVLEALGRPWPRADVIRILPQARHALVELESRGILSTCDIESFGTAVHLSPFSRAFAPAMDAGVRDEVILTLRNALPEDPFAAMRVAELCADNGRHQEADDASLKAIALAPDAEARDDFWHRFEELSGRDEEGAARALHTAEFALRVGDVSRAELYGKRAVAARPDAADALLVLGKAYAANADYSAAQAVLEKAIALGPGVHRATAQVELADVKYTTGDLTQAERLADEALSHADASVALAARNVKGKLLLARKAYDAALEHFCADEHEAMAAGDRTSELRAQVNRAIALLALWRRDEARQLLEHVLETAMRVGEPRAVTHALGNLATIALLEHRYVEALERYEAAIDATRRLGDKGRLVRFVCNLAEVRIRLGLVKEAKQVLALARRTCGTSTPRLGHFHLVCARTHLADGNTGETIRAVGRALACFGHSLVPTESEAARDVRLANSLGWAVGECLRVAARAVLDDGDLQRAGQFLERASTQVHTPYARAELALLRADLSLARGEASIEAADAAICAARDADDDEFAREAHAIMVRAALAQSDDARARRHLDDAIRKRDAVLAALPPAMRERYLERRDLLSLDQLRARVAEAPVPSRPSEPAPAAAPAPVVGRRIVGNDPQIQRLLRSVAKVGRASATVLIRGESGTGKELVAEALHAASDRASGPLVKVNCAALVETLLLSELFGHEKGSFTGAAGRRRGRFEAADGGTLFLDEIGDISHRTQVALLRVLQEKTFERVGGTAPVRVDVRVVCATHRDLRAMVERGEFREDLYYRLCGVTLEVPALRERRGDLEAIANAILARIAQDRGEPARRVSAQALGVLRMHAWPGNIRELENALRAASLFAEGGELGIDDFTLNVDSLRYLGEASTGLGSSVAALDDVPPRSSTSARSPEISPSSQGFGGARSVSGASAAGASATGASATGASATGASATGTSADSLSGEGSATDVAYAAIRSGVSLGDMKKQIERECISRALGESGGNITRAATLLGMKRPRLSQLVKQYGFADVDEERGAGVGPSSCGANDGTAEDDDAEDC